MHLGKMVAAKAAVACTTISFAVRPEIIITPAENAMPRFI
jgi:hypothetical protein